MRIAFFQNSTGPYPAVYPWRTHDKAEYMHMHIPLHIIMAFEMLHAFVMQIAPSFIR